MVKKKVLALTGNDAVAYAMKQINPDVVAAYPITPQTSLMQKFADYVSDGEVNSELVLVESEHSALSATCGASASGARAMTATSSNGLAFMWEILYIASGLRLPIVMPVVNRTLSAPLNIHCDHSDAMGARDSGWIQLFSENAQEAYENTIQAVRIAEDPEVLLPCMVNLDGFVISHGVENVEVYEDKLVEDFIGEYKPKISLLDTEHPASIGAIVLPDSLFEFKRQQSEGMRNALNVVKKVGEEFGKVFGKTYGFSEHYRLEDAEIAVLGLGSTMGTLKYVVDENRKKGVKLGLLKIRLFRPFPQEEILERVKHLKAIAVLDRSDALDGIGGPLFTDIKSALYSKVNLQIINYIYGLGGRDITIENLQLVCDDLIKLSKTQKIEKLLTYLGVKE